MSVSRLMSGYTAEVDIVNRRDWTEILKIFADATIYQTWSYGAVRWGENRLSHLILRKQGEILAAAQCTLKVLPGIKAGIAYIPWGPLWHRKEENSDPSVFQQMIRALEQEYIRKRGLLLRVAPNEIDEGENPIIDILKTESFLFDPSQPARRSLIMDVRLSMDELRKNLKRQWRQNLQHAESQRIKIVQGTSDELYGVFTNIYRQMRNRKDFETAVDVEEFGRIQKDLPEEFRMNIMVCEVEDQPVAAYVTSFLGDTAIGLLAATDEKALTLRAAYLLQWRLIEYLKSRGGNWYDLGGIDPEKNPGGYQYKSGLSGKIGRDVRQVGQYYKCEKLASSLVVHMGDTFRRISAKLKRGKHKFAS